MRGELAGHELPEPGGEDERRVNQRHKERVQQTAGGGGDTVAIGNEMGTADGWRKEGTR